MSQLYIRGDDNRRKFFKRQSKLVRIYLALPARLKPWCVFNVRIGHDCTSFIEFVRR